MSRKNFKESFKSSLVVARVAGLRLQEPGEQVLAFGNENQKLKPWPSK
jgi:hypothetical protein